MISCARHNRFEADFHCAKCQAGFCRACAKQKLFGPVKIIVCPNCGEKLTDLSTYRAVMPFWYRVPQILFFPLQGDGWMMIAGWLVFAAVLKTLAAMPHWASIFFGLLYNGVLISYFYRVIAKAEDGKLDIPDWSEISGSAGGGSGQSILWDSFMKPYLVFLVSCLLVFWPLVAFLFLAYYAEMSPVAVGVFTFILFLMGLFFLPMDILIMGVFKNVFYAANPYFLGNQIAKIWKEYVLAVLFMVSLIIIYYLFSIGAGMSMSGLGLVKYLLILPVEGVLELYLAMVIGHLLGYLAYQTRFKLKWWPETQEEPSFLVAGKSQAMEWSPDLKTSTGPMPGAGGAYAAAVAVAAGVAGAAVAAVAASPGGKTMYGDPEPAAAPPPAAPAARPAAAPRGRPSPAPAAATVNLDPEAQELLTREINDGMSLIQHGRHEEAVTLYDRILSQDPSHLGALRGRMLAAAGLHDKEAVSKYAQLMGAELARQEAFDLLWETYQETRAQDPGFLLRARDQIALSRWLVSEGKALDAARVLREIGVGKPEDPLAPKALYQCAELLWKSCGKPDVAKQMFEYILKRYPQSAFGDQVRAALSQLGK